MMKDLLGLFCCFIITVAPAEILGRQLSEKDLPQQYFFKTWDNTYGLPQNTVFNIVSDETGYLWAATEGGLVRFDGSRFKIFDTNIFPDLPSVYFVDISLASGGGVWAASHQHIILFKGNSREILSLRKNLKSSHITNIAEDKNGILWAGTNTGSLFYIKDKVINEITSFNEYDGEQIQVVKPYKNHVVVGTTHGLYKISENKFTEIPAFKGISVKAISVAKNDDLWIGTLNDGAYRHDGQDVVRFTENEGLPDNNITGVAVAKDGKPWIATANSGIAVLESGVFKKLDVDDLEFNNIRSIYAANNDLIWVGTSISGLIQVQRAEVLTLPPELSLDTQNVLPIYEHPNGEIWVGTLGKGIKRIQNGKVISYATSDDLSNEIIRSINGDENYIFIGTESGLKRFNLRTKKIDRSFTTKDGLVHNSVHAVHKDSKNRIWVITRSGGIHILKNNKIERIPVPNSLVSAELRTIYEDSQQNIWIGSNGSGLVKISPSGELQHLSTELPSNVVLSFYEDEEGDMWFGSSRALSVFQEDSVITFNTSNNLMSQEYYTLIEDNYGYLWSSSNSGLQRISVEDMLAAKRDNNREYTFEAKFLNSSHGMPNSETIGGIFPSAYKMQNGSIWFPTVDGVAIVDPKHIGYTADSANVHIESIKYSNKEVLPDSRISIPAGVHTVEVNFASIEFSDPESVHYYYRIKELNDEWQYAGNRNTAYLTLLNHGAYTFEVRAREYNNWSDPASFQFDIQPFFHQTLWFKGLILFFLFIAGFLAKQLHAKYQMETRLKGLIDLRTKDLQNALGEKNVLLQEVHHRVKNNLAIISGLMELQKFSTDNEELQAGLNDSQARIKSIASIHETLYQRENFSRLDFKEIIEKLISNVTMMFEAQAKVEYHQHLESVEINVNQAIPAALLLNEIITNSLRHAFKGRDRGSITVQLSETNEQVFIKVADDGIGFESETPQSNEKLGRELIRILAKQLNSNLSVCSESGTKYSLTFEKSEMKGSASNLVIPPA